MAGIECMTVTMPTEMAEAVRNAVEAGDYASTSDAISAALRDWTAKRTHDQAFADLKADIDAGLADVSANRVRNFDAKLIAKRGRKILASRSTSA